VSDSGIVDPALISKFRRDGWAVIPHALDDKIIGEARRALSGIYPTYEQLERSPREYAWVTDGQFGGLRLWPVDVLFLDLLPLHDAVVAVAEALVGSDDLRLLRAGYQAKYGSTVDYTQVLHFDYPNHSLVVPGDNDIVGFFLYLSDVTADLGPTMVVSDADRGPLLPDRTHLMPAEEYPGIYACEQAAVGRAGSLLAYRSTTYHRGSAITAPRGVRLTLGFAYGRPAPWTGFQAFPRLGEEPGLTRAVAAATPRQRTLLGFPAPGDPYWNQDTLAAVARRYPGFNPAEYV
jgi:ectoine hydroxylase-related dioxygenase (phytanoyl-CoA dioxygenase family)